MLNQKKAKAAVNAATTGSAKTKLQQRYNTLDRAELERTIVREQTTSPKKQRKQQKLPEAVINTEIKCKESKKVPIMI